MFAGLRQAEGPRRLELTSSCNLGNTRADSRAADDTARIHQTQSLHFVAKVTLGPFFTVAATNKCLAQMNNSAERDTATKKRHPTRCHP
jgi:hypothetical protein